MANLNDLFPSRYLKSADLQGREPIVTIARVTIEEMGRARERKLVCYFQGKEKGLPCGKGMATSIAAIAKTTETDAWPGTKVQLYGTTATFGDTVYDVVRIKAPAGRVQSVSSKLSTTKPVIVTRVTRTTGTDGPIAADDVRFGFQEEP